MVKVDKSPLSIFFKRISTVLIFFWLTHPSKPQENIRKPGSDTSCAVENFLHLGESKFYYSPKPLKWEDAQNECKGVGMKMATIGSSAENNKLGLRLIDTFVNLKKPRAQKVWVGAKDTNNQGIYEWADGSPMMYMNYGSPRPDLDVGKHICLHVGFPAGGSNYLQWKQDDCRKSRQFLCETDKKECFIADSVAKDPLLLKIFGTKYFLSLQRLNWADALEFCEAQHLRLVSFLAPSSIDELGGILSRHHQLPSDFSFWTSGSHHILDYNEDKPLWMATGTIADGRWHAWAREEPSDQGFSSPNRRCRTRTEMCVEARLIPEEKIEWAASDCMMPLPFVCTKPSVCQLQSGGVVAVSTNIGTDTSQQLGRKTKIINQKISITETKDEIKMDAKRLDGFYFSYLGIKYFLANDAYHWRDAFKDCLRRGMDMYTPSNDNEDRKIGDFLWKNKSPIERCKYWLAGIDLGNPFHHWWIGSGEPVKNVKYLDRQTPNNTALPTCLYLQLCEEKSPSIKDYKWKVQSCHDPFHPKLSFICQQKKNCK